MEVGQVNKMLAYSFVSELIKKKKVKKKGLVDGLSLEANEDAPDSKGVDSAEMSFGDLEDYYKNVLSVIENTPEIRESIVSALKNVHEQGGDLNELYPAKLIAREASLKSMLFLEGDEEDI